MPGSTKFSYDAKRNIVSVEPHWELSSREEVDRFFAEYVRYLSSLNREVYMLADISHLKIHPSLVEYYGEMSRTSVLDHLLGFARFGGASYDRMLIRFSTLKAHLDPNIYATREEALAAIEEMQRSTANRPPG